MQNETTTRLGDQMKAAADTMKTSAEKVGETGSELGMRLLDQAETNTREAFAAMRATAQARDAAEVLRIQGEYLRDQSARAMTQAREIGEMISGFGREMFGQIARRDVGATGQSSHDGPGFGSHAANGQPAANQPQGTPSSHS